MAGLDESMEVTVSPSERVSMTVPAHVGDARRAAVRMGVTSQLDAGGQGRLGLVVTEAASNVIKHGGGGDVLLRYLDGGRGVEMLALDRGAGMRDPSASLRDGHSTSGTLGTGLGAIGRQADVFDLYSRSGAGTALLAQVWRDGARHPAGAAAGTFIVGGVCLPKVGELSCGDMWRSAGTREGLRVIVCDGLGHGPEAARASAEASRAFDRLNGGSPAEWVAAMHEALRATRGAALAVVAIDPGREQLVYCGIGNIAAQVVNGSEARHLVSANGTVGHEIRRPQEVVVPFPTGALLVIHSDGVSTRWDLGHHPGLAAHHPALLAGVLFRDHGRARDDATVVVVKSA